MLMADTQTFKERLIMFIQSLGINIRQFEITVGLSNGYVKNIRKGMQADKVALVSKQYPQLNTSWLYTGDGEMLKKVDCTTNNISVQNSTQVGNNTINNNDNRINELTKMVLDTLAEIRDLKKSHEEDKKKMLDMQQQMLNIISELSKEVHK